MSYLALLSGMAEGYGNEASKQGEEKRQAKITNDRLLADSINKRLAEDDTLDWPTYSNLRQQEYKLRGADPKGTASMLQHEQALWGRHQQIKQQGMVTNPNGGYDPAQSDDPGAAGQAPGGAMPQAPPTTSGDLRATAKASAQGIMDQATLAKQKAQLELVNGPQGQQPQSFPMNGSVETAPAPRMRKKTGLAANGSITESQEPEQPKLVPGLVYGEDVLKDFPNAQGIDKTGWYRKGRYDSTGEIVHYPGQPITTQKIVYDENSPTRASYVRQDPRGNIIGEPEVGAPSNLLPKTAKKTTLTHYTDPVDGQVHWRTIETDTTTGPEINSPGGTATPTSPLPTPKSRAQASITGGVPQGASAPAGKQTYHGIQGGPAGTVPIVTPPSGTKVISDPRDMYLAGQIASGRMKIGDVKGDGRATSQKQMQGKVQDILAALNLDINKVTTSQLDTANFAKSLENHYPDILSLVDKLDQEGKLGPIAGRFNEFMTGKFGAGDPEYTRLRNDLGLVQTALMKIHTGSRGSTTIMSKFANLIDGRNMDARTLKASLEEAKLWVDGYAQLVPTGDQALQGTGVGRGGANVTPNSPVPGTTVPSVGDNFQGSKVKSIKQIQ